YVLGLSLGNSVIKIVTGTLFIAGALALVATYRRLTGVWVSGFDATGRAGRTAKVMGALVAVIVVAAWAITYLTDLNWPAWILAAVAFAGTIVLGRRFDDELRAQLRAGA
ncbi:MAG TPA: hypothetical protein VHN18_02945, partial [Micromonosporaceae bacterium]|nr:hypothetical protein [Micromonosporaceae bacterium]